MNDEIAEEQDSDEYDDFASEWIKEERQSDELDISMLELIDWHRDGMDLNESDLFDALVKEANERDVESKP